MKYSGLCVLFLTAALFDWGCEGQVDKPNIHSPATVSSDVVYLSDPQATTELSNEEIESVKSSLRSMTFEDQKARRLLEKLPSSAFNGGQLSEEFTQTWRFIRSVNEEHLTELDVLFQ